MSCVIQFTVCLQWKAINFSTKFVYIVESENYQFWRVIFFLFSWKSFVDWNWTHVKSSRNLNLRTPSLSKWILGDNSIGQHLKDIVKFSSTRSLIIEILESPSSFYATLLKTSPQKTHKHARFLIAYEKINRYGLFSRLLCSMLSFTYRWIDEQTQFQICFTCSRS